MLFLDLIGQKKKASMGQAQNQSQVLFAKITEADHKLPKPFYFAKI